MAGEGLPAGGRFTAYLPAERELLQALSAEEGSSENYLLRIGVRALLGLPIPAHYRARVRENLEDGSLAGQPKAAA
jgi:hypothetical protein